MTRPDPTIARTLRSGVAATALPLDAAALLLLRSPASLRAYRAGRRPVPFQLLALLAGELQRQAETAPADIAGELHAVGAVVRAAGARRLLDITPLWRSCAADRAARRALRTGGPCA